MKDLREDPELIQGAVEEMLRYLSVAHHVAFRLAKADIEISDICIHAGDGVIAPVSAANHDPEVFPEPQAFDVRRDARDHVAFGFGVHQCLGQHLARLRTPSCLHQASAAISYVALGSRPGGPPLQGLDDLRGRALPGQLVRPPRPA